MSQDGAPLSTAPPAPAPVTPTAPATPAALTAPTAVSAARHPLRSSALRFFLIHLAQLPAIALVIFGTWPLALWLAALWSSAVCCAGTDSLWRWRNRLLIAEAALWLAFAMLFSGV